MKVVVCETCGDSWSKSINIEYDSKSEHDCTEADKFASRIIPKPITKLKFEPE